MINVSGSALSLATNETIDSLNAIVQRLAEKDHTLWGAEAEAEAAIRLIGSTYLPPHASYYQS